MQRVLAGRVVQHGRGRGGRVGLWLVVEVWVWGQVGGAGQDALRRRAGGLLRADEVVVVMVQVVVAVGVGGGVPQGQDIPATVG